MSTIIDGSAGVTFPTGSGTQGAQSKVLQVVNATYSTETLTTSTSYITSGLSASITPLFSTSKIYVIVSFTTYNGASNQGLLYQISRGSTSIYSTPVYGVYAGASNLITTCAINLLDSPATTSSTTYTFQFASGGGGTSVRVQYNSAPSIITLMEIAQ